MDVREISGSVRRTFASCGGKYGLVGERIQARYVLNRGGFENASFTVTDGERSLHLKLAGGEEARTRLLRWHSLRSLLEERYHAPRILDWMDLADGTGGGLLFEHIEGTAPELSPPSHTIFGVLELLSRLHADEDLARRLPSAPGRTCADVLCNTYVRRFEDDLEIVERDPPPFVGRHLLDWMHDETRTLESLVRAAPAFAVPAEASVHGDLWPGNLMETAGGLWYVLDWDDLGLGDPAMDYGFLLPETPPEAAASLCSAHDDRQIGKRLPLYTRAILLDGVIDVLADYVECEVASDHRDAVRERIRTEHAEALARYSQRYGGPGG